MKVLSLFDGISCARVALERAGIPVEAYYSSEIDEYAKKVSSKNYPYHHWVGDVRYIGCTDTNPAPQNIDLLIGGSPCQDLSIAKKDRKGLDGERSGLFWEYVRILREVKPKYFILENVASMPKEAKDIITKELGVEPIMINAALVSAQNRKRLFWVGKIVQESSKEFYTVKVDIPQPEDRGIMLKDIVHEMRGEDFDVEKYKVKGNHLEWITDPIRLKKKYTSLGGDKSLTMMARQYANWNGQYLSVRVGQIGKGGQGERIYSLDGKSVALSALGGGRGAKTGLYLILQRGRGRNKGGLKALNGKTPVLTSSKWQDNNHLLTDSYVRKLTPMECCRLQGLNDEYIGGSISDSQAYKCLGNAFNVDVVAHILSFMK